MKVSQIQEISEKIKEFGVVTVNDLLNSEQFKLANNILKYVYDKSISKGNIQGHFPILLKSIIIKLIKFEFSKLKKSFLLKKIAKDLQLKKIVEKIIDHEAELHMIDSYYSERSDRHILDWHNDIGYDTTDIADNEDRNLDAKSIKFFIYMTDVKSANGSLAYIPYSHHIVRAITSLMLEKKIKFHTYWKLEDLRTLVLKDQVKNLIIDKVGVEKLNIFLNNSKFIEQETKDTFKFDFEMNKGGAVIFDELGMHRGAKPSKHSRLVLRYLYRRKI